MLVRTSNPGGADIQELELADGIARLGARGAHRSPSLAPVARRRRRRDAAGRGGACARADAARRPSCFPAWAPRAARSTRSAPAFAPGPAAASSAPRARSCTPGAADGRWQAAAAAEAGAAAGGGLGRRGGRVSKTPPPREQAAAPRRPGGAARRWAYLAPAALLGAVTVIVLILVQRGLDRPSVRWRAPPSTGPVGRRSRRSRCPTRRRRPAPAAARSRRRCRRLRRRPRRDAETTARVRDHARRRRRPRPTTRRSTGDDDDRRARPARQVDGQARRHAVLDRHAVRDERQGARAPQPDDRPRRAAGRSDADRALSGRLLSRRPGLGRRRRGAVEREQADVESVSRTRR